MSKLIAALLALLICVCALASCGGEQTPDNPNTAAKTEGTVTTEAPTQKEEQSTEAPTPDSVREWSDLY